MAKMDRGRGGRRAGTAEDDGVVIVKEPAGGIGRVRCPLTHELAVPALRPDGTRVLRTRGGVEYRRRRL